MLKLHESRVADFIRFMYLYSQEQELPQCAIIYESLVQFCEDLKAFLITFASTNNINSELDVPKCKLIFSAWNEEVERVNALFGKVQDLVEKYKKILREHLFEPSKRLIEELIDSLLSTRVNHSFIRGAYKIYSAYDVMHPRLVHVFRQVLMERVSSKPKNDMSHIMKCIIWADSLLRDCFEENKDYTFILDKVLRPVFSENTSYTSKLAVRIDKVIRTQNVLIENLSENRQLYALMTHLRFVEDKETLRADYAHFLALRLMTWRQQASDILNRRIKIEKQINEYLGKACGSRFVEHINHMLADVEKEKENAKDLLPVNMNSNVEVMVLTRASWPKVKSEWSSEIWPERLQAVSSVAASNYAAKFKTRKLEWLPELSSVTVKMGNSLVKLSVVQYSFLSLLLQKGSRASKADCLAYFGLTEDALASLIFGLTACGLVRTDDDMYLIDEAAVDTFSPSVDLAFVVRQRVPEENQPSPSALGALNQPRDYDALAQCHLVQISKREGKKGRLLKNVLFKKTKDALSSQISLADSFLEAQLKVLMERGFLEMDAKEKFIKYCP